MKKNENKETKKNENNSCTDNACWKHNGLKVRGRNFKGYVVRKFPKRIAIEFERVIYVQKYERYTKKKTRIHARLPDCMQEEVKLGDYVLVGECRPLSKIIHFVYLRKIRDSSVKQGEEK